MGFFASFMEFADSPFRLDFSRLLDVLADALSTQVSHSKQHIPIEVGDLYFYTAIFDIPDHPDPEWGDIGFIRHGSEARTRFAGAAIDAGFNPDGIFRVPLRGWMVEKLREHRYQEKMVDTSLVARLVEQAIADPSRLHVLISGDVDMLPAISTVVPDYTKTVVLDTTHPAQYEPESAQSSFRLSQFKFNYEPIYLERHVDRLVEGTYIYRCSNPRCQHIFTRPSPVPAYSNPICKPCYLAKGSR